MSQFFIPGDQSIGVSSSPQSQKTNQFQTYFRIKYVKSFRVVKDSRGNLKLLIFQMNLLRLTESERFGQGYKFLRNVTIVFLNEKKYIDKKKF